MTDYLSTRCLTRSPGWSARCVCWWAPCRPATASWSPGWWSHSWPVPSTWGWSSLMTGQTRWRQLSDPRVCQCCHYPGGLAECGGAGVHQPGGHPGLGTLQRGQVAAEEWTWSLWLLWTGVDGHFVLFAMTFCNYNQDKESKMAGLGNKKSEVAKVLYFLNFRINIKIVLE